MKVPPQFENLTSLLLYIDTHFIDSADPDARELIRLHEEGWIQLQRTDTLDTELAGAPEAKRRQLLEASAQYVESFGPMVLDHSQVDHTVVASEEDQHRLRAVYDILYGSAEKVRDNDLRDAMHVATAIRYAAFGFVTLDRRILRRAADVREQFLGFRLMTPAAAKTEALERIRRLRIVNAARDVPDALPKWPPAGSEPSPQSRE